MSSDKKPLTEMQEKFLDALCGEAQGNIRAAMGIAGYSEHTKSYEVVNPIKDEIVERASLMLAMNAPKATFGMLNVLDDPGALGARNAIAAASQIMDRAGLVKREQVEVRGLTGGIFVLPPKHAPIDDEGD